MGLVEVFRGLFRGTNYLGIQYILVVVLWATRQVSSHQIFTSWTDFLIYSTSIILGCTQNPHNTQKYKFLKRPLVDQKYVAVSMLNVSVRFNSRLCDNCVNTFCNVQAGVQVKT